MPKEHFKHNSFIRAKKLTLLHCRFLQKIYKYSHFEDNNCDAITLHCPNYFFLMFLGQPKVVSCRLPTHSREAHRKNFRGSLLKLKSKFWFNMPYLTVV